MKKTIHIYTQYYFPVSNACSNRIEKYILALKDEYDIKIITGMPNYPTGIKEKKYRWRLFKKEIGQYGEKIIRTYEIATKNEGTISRLLNYTSFMLSSFLYGLFAKRPDTIIVTSPPLFTAIGVLFLHKIKKIPYILEIRDLWPESVVALGYMKKNSLSYKIFHYLELSLYKNASKIIGVTKGIVDDIDKMGDFKDKLFLQYNVAEKINGKYLKNPYLNFTKKIKGRKVALFAGNLNESFSFDGEGIEYIKNNKEIFFFFIGGGIFEDTIKRLVKEVDNVYYLSVMSKKKLSNYIYYSDLIFIPTKKDSFFRGSIPVKGIEGIVNDKDIIFLGPEGEFTSILKLKNKKNNFTIDKFKFNILNIINHENKS